MRTSLATRWRPKTFDEVGGQSITVEVLKKATQLRSFKNVYLFAGDSGTGKTTCARIFANEINQGVGAPIEIDAASNNGVDQVRAIIDEAHQRSLVGEYKIFIIDECHAITAQGWQAFLKGLEEPAPYTIFIFCTTEPNKIPLTVLNRMQRYNFTKIEADVIRRRLEYICEQEGFKNYQQTCDLISKLCKGCMRDAITYLDQCADYSNDLSLDNAKRMLSKLSFEPLFALTWALQEKDIGKMLSIVDKLYSAGTDIKEFMDTYLDFALDLCKFSIFKNIKITDIPEYLATEDNPVVQQTVAIHGGSDWFLRLVDCLLEIKQSIKYDVSYKSTAEAMLMRLCKNED